MYTLFIFLAQEHNQPSSKSRIKPLIRVGTTEIKEDLLLHY